MKGTAKWSRLLQTGTPVLHTAHAGGVLSQVCTAASQHTALQPPTHLLAVLLVPGRQVAGQVGQADSRHKAGVWRAPLLDGPQQAAHHAAVLQHGLGCLRVAAAECC